MRQVLQELELLQVLQERWLLVQVLQQEQQRALLQEQRLLLERLEQLVLELHK